jgi:carotenoid cleavage dioxygenase-like enzyme
MAATLSESDYQAWNNLHLYALTTESTSEEKIDFQGEIPDWLKGTLYRNGSGANEINNDVTT